MNISSVLDAPEAKTASPSGSPSRGLSDLVAAYAEVQPRTEWLKKLDLQEPRENLECLPVLLRVSKRLFDIAAASLLLLVCSPLMIVSALLVKLTSPGPVIYKQTRVGLNLRKKKSSDRRQGNRDIVELNDRRQSGRDRRERSNFGQPFTIYKFRTMRNDAEKGGAQFAKQGDVRVTAIGRFMRRTRIDELPQLWNVIKGEMSLVGPRPERPEFMQHLSSEIPNYVDRLGLKPGLTGLAQVVNGYDNELDGFRKKVAYDLLYLQNCCITNDIRILLRTFRVVITGEGAL
ncbi:MAG: sugar transferase [Planctomycetaceae bacterium]|nr:sugar transferase [Planctomycetaceae bacterium]